MMHVGAELQHGLIHATIMEMYDKYTEMHLAQFK